MAQISPATSNKGRLAGVHNGAHIPVTSAMWRQSAAVSWLTVCGSEGDGVAGRAVAGAVVALHATLVARVEVQPGDQTVRLPPAVGVL